MKAIVGLVLHLTYIMGAIRKSVLYNRLSEIKPVGPLTIKKFMPLTEFPPAVRPMAGRRHFEMPEDCTPTPSGRDVIEGGTVRIFGDYYDDHIGKTMATVIIPDHIDRKHFEVTTQVPYLTVGNIDAIGFHPTTPPAMDDCERIYQDHLMNQYSDEESEDMSEESLEVIRVPAAALNPEPQAAEDYAMQLFSD